MARNILAAAATAVPRGTVAAVLLFLVLVLLLAPTVAAADVTGTVSDRRNGAPVAGATVDLRTPGGSGTLVASDQTDADGAFGLTEVPAGTYELSVRARGYHPWKTNITVDSNTSVPIVIDASVALDESASKSPPPARSGGLAMSPAAGCGPFGAMTLFLVSSAFVGTLLFARIHRNNLLQNAVRKRIYDHLTANPGRHYRALLADLRLPMGVLTHHLNALERGELVSSYQDGAKRRFFPAGRSAELSFMLSDMQSRIVLALQSNAGISQANLADTLQVSRPLLNYHIKILRDAGVVRLEHLGRETACFLVAVTTVPGAVTAGPA